MKDNVRLSIVVLLMSLPLVALSQDETLPVDQIEVIKAFDARLIEAEKLGFRGKLPELDTIPKKRSYAVTSPVAKLDYGTPSLRPLALKPEELGPVYNGYLKAGYGVPRAFTAGLGYTFSDAQTHVIQVTAEHQSANKKNLSHQQFSSTAGWIKGSWYAPSGLLQLSPSLYYGSDDRYYYGYDHGDTSEVYNNYKQRLRNFEFSTLIRNPERLDGEIQYEGKFMYAHTGDAFDMREEHFLLSLMGEKFLGGRHPLRMEVIADFTTMKNPHKFPLHNFFFNPSFTIQEDSYKIRLGGKLASHEDRYIIFPDLQADFQVAGNQFVAFAMVEGGLTKNSFKMLSTYNPWIESPLDSILNTRWSKYSAGLKGQVKGFFYEGSLTYSSSEDVALFLPSENDTRKFSVLYDDGNIVSFEATVLGEPVKGWQLGVTLVKHVYDMDNEERAWHLPSLEMECHTKYLAFGDRLTLEATLAIGTGVALKNSEGDPDRLNNLTDLSLAGKYYIIPELAGFIEVNNLFSNNYQRWQNYPSYGVMILGGLFLRI